MSDRADGRHGTDDDTHGGLDDRPVHRYTHGIGRVRVGQEVRDERETDARGGNSTKR
jgi:hypothetical protein